ncbi:hypothetical protein [Methylobacterium sp. Gmos1]
MAALLPHHLKIASARAQRDRRLMQGVRIDASCQGTRYSLDTGKLPRLDSDEGRARLFGWDREDLTDRLIQAGGSVIIVACASIFLGSAIRLVWLVAL